MRINVFCSHRSLNNPKWPKRNQCATRKIVSKSEHSTGVKPKGTRTRGSRRPFTNEATRSGSLIGVSSKGLSVDLSGPIVISDDDSDCYIVD